MGIIGLGAGALAAYARKGDTFRFYEIDPQVAAVAMSEFSFLEDSPAQTEIILGDGRLSLERESPQAYDVLAIDAFSGDSIPMHLLTREAMETYLKHLKPDGVIVFQATNRFVDIAPVVERVAAEFGLASVLVSDQPDGNLDERTSLLGFEHRSDHRDARQGAPRGARDPRHGASRSRRVRTFACGRTTSTTCCTF